MNGTNRRTARRGCTILLAILLTTAIAVGAAGAAPSTKPDIDMTGTGPSPAGAGLLSKAALAQKTCDPATGRTDFAYVGTGPFCVNPWPAGKDNGGATAPGVTATSVKVVVRIPNPQMAAQMASGGVQNARNQATGEMVSADKSIVDYNTLFAYATKTYGTYQLWGRTPDFQFYTATGSDEAAQRADALAVAAMQPFLVFDFSGGDAFVSAIAARKIIVFGSGTNEAADKQAPYRWLLASDPDALLYLTPNFVGRSLAGRKAQWAGDPSLRSKTRSIGVVSPSDRVDISVFQSELKKAGAKAPAQAAAYDGTDPNAAAQAIPTIVSKLKSTGVTTVVLLVPSDIMKALMAAATSQDYRPEWIITGFDYHDFDGFGRMNDQTQMAHAFGVGILPPAFEGQGGSASSSLFQWYWGTKQGNYAETTSVPVSVTYQVLHYAGPTLTAANVKKGLFSMPAYGGAAQGLTAFQDGYGRTVRLPYDEHGTPGTDRVLAWWNPDLVGGTQAVSTLVGKGRLMYLDQGRRLAYGQFPAQEPKFFDPSASVVEIPWATTFPGGVVPAAMPCTGCPVNGGSSAAAS